MTASAFLDVLSGNKQAVEGVGSGRVIESTHKDTVVVYFADHGTLDTSLASYMTCMMGCIYPT